MLLFLCTPPCAAGAASTNAASTCTGLPVGSAAATNAATAHAPSTASAADAAWTSATGIATSGASWTQPPTSDWGVSRHNTFGSSDIGMYNGEEGPAETYLV